METAKRNIHILQQHPQSNLYIMSSSEKAKASSGTQQTTAEAAGDRDRGRGNDSNTNAETTPAKPFVFPTDDLALPKGSLILVTGATGYIASHVVNEALALGYRVRGSVRNEEKANYLKNEVFAEAAKAGTFETVIVSDLSDAHGFDAAVRGVDGIVHLASVLSFSSDPNEVVPVTVAGAVNLLKAAAAEPNRSVKRFVYTSSSTAASLTILDKVFHIDASTWNEAAVAKVQSLTPPYLPDPQIAYTIYGASKTEAERAVWKFVEDHRAHAPPDSPLPFTVNAVLPNLNVGRVLGPAGYTATIVPSILDGSFKPSFVTPQWFVDVIDDARVHLAALLDKTVANQRLFAYASPYDWNDFVDAVNKARPDRSATILPRLPPHGKDLSIVDNAAAEALLTKWYPVSGWKSLEQSVVENLEGK
ncbi:hypothetical protein DV738_g57, partial [Chaetothyriales sp. CBS 135597]